MKVKRVNQNQHQHKQQLSDSKGNKIQIDPNEELLKKIRTRKISVDVEDINGKKKLLKKLLD